MALDVPMIWCMDTWGQPSVEADVVGAHAAMNSGVTHPNYPIQVDSLVLTTELQSHWSSNLFTVAGTTFNYGFWIHIHDANMGEVGSQKIISLSTDGGTNPDIEILHTSLFPSAGFRWTLIGADGLSYDTVVNPFAENTWTWCNLYYERHNTTGNAVLYVHNLYPGLGKTIALSTANMDTEGVGAGTSAEVRLTGHINTPVAGWMDLRFGGGYFMDGITSPDSEVLNHRAFHSLRPEKDHVTPDVKWNGLSPDPSDDLDAGLWKDLGDFNRPSAGQYTAVAGKGGAVQTKDYNFSTSILNADVNVGKFVYDIGARPASAARYVYGSYDVSAGTYSVANVTCSALQFEHVIYSGDAQWPVMTNLAAARAIPVVGFGNASGTSGVGCAEAAFVKMWPKGAPGTPDIHSEHYASVIGQCVSRGVAV